MVNTTLDGYNDYLTDMGLPHICVAINGVEKDRMSEVGAMAYANRAHKNFWEPVEGQPGKYNLRTVIDNYGADVLVNNVRLSGVADNAYKFENVDPRTLDEKLDTKPHEILRYIV